MCALWYLHPNPSNTYSCQQLRQLLQEQAVEERGGVQEEGEGPEKEGDGGFNEG